MFKQGDRVKTPAGVGTVAYRRMAPPEFTRAAVYSVKLDHRTDAGYAGSLFLARYVTAEGAEGAPTAAIEAAAEVSS